jgi:hypothetical protein
MAKAEITAHIADLPAIKAALEAAAEKLGRVEALAEEDERSVPILRIYANAAESADQRFYWNVMGDVREQSAARIRAALATPVDVAVTAEVTAP